MEESIKSCWVKISVYDLEFVGHVACYWDVGVHAMSSDVVWTKVEVLRAGEPVVALVFHLLDGNIPALRDLVSPNLKIFWLFIILFLGVYDLLTLGIDAFDINNSPLGS